MHNDTLFAVTGQTLVPHITFNLGDKQASYEHRNNPEYNKRTYFIYYIRRTNRYIFFIYKDNKNYRCGYYDKHKQKTKLCKTDREGGFTCNINDLPAIFFPRYFNSKGEAYGTILPEELLEYYKSRDKSMLSNNARKVLENMREDDNPIFAIGQPKKK